MKYREAVAQSYQTSKYKDIISENNYVLLGRLYMFFIFKVMNNAKLLRVRFPGLCLFYPSPNTIQKSIDSLTSRNVRPERVIELNNILNNLSKDGKIKQKKTGESSRER